MAYRKKIIFLQDIKEMNYHIKWVSQHREIVFRTKDKDEPCRDTAFISDGMVRFSLCYRAGGKTIDYVIRKDGVKVMQTIDGGEAYRIMSLYYKAPIAEIEASASPFLWNDKRYENQRIKNCVGYDMNSAYAWAMTQPLPDTTAEPRAGIVKPDEIGFMNVPCRNLDHYSLTPVFEGYATHIFPKTHIAPLAKFANVWYNNKRNATDELQKAKAKNVILYSVGMLQNKNPFLRAAIVGHCNKRINDLIDENTIYCNTDAIISSAPRPDIPIGDGLGEFKIENSGDFAYKGFNYQWNNEKPSYRGIPKTWFKPKWDILKDELPVCGNIIAFDRNKLQLRRISYAEFKSKTT